MRALQASVRLAALAALAVLLLAACAVALAQSSTDYDADDDGLIEVASLAQLNAIRWDLDGDGSPASANASDYSSAFPNAATGMGCPSTGCTGYELTTNLDFDTNGDGRTDVAGDAYWNDGYGWDPIRTRGELFTATFEGNGNTISKPVRQHTVSRLCRAVPLSGQCGSDTKHWGDWGGCHG